MIHSHAAHERNERRDQDHERDLILNSAQDNPLGLTRLEDITSLAWVRDLRDARIEKWTDALMRAGLTEFEILPRGAVHNGHYIGPKQRETSWSEKIPTNLRELVEIDLRIVLPEEFNPRDRVIVDAVMEAVGAQSKYDEEGVWDGLTEWDDKPDCAYVYRFEPLLPARGIGIEWEIGLYRQPVCPVDQYWHVVFDAEEVGWQRDVRRLVMAEGPRFGVDYKRDFWELKRDQCHVGVARIVAALAIPRLCANLGSDGQLILDHFGSDFERVVSARSPNPKITEPRIQAWLAGQFPYTVRLGVPEHLPKPIVETVEAVGKTELMALPRPARWVTAADAIFRALRNGTRIDIHEVMAAATPSLDTFGAERIN